MNFDFYPYGSNIQGLLYLGRGRGREKGKGGTTPLGKLTISPGGGKRGRGGDRIVGNKGKSRMAGREEWGSIALWGTLYAPTKADYWLGRVSHCG